MTPALLTIALLVAQPANPCTDPPPPIVLNPTQLFSVLPEHTQTLPDGTPAVTDYRVGYFADGVDPNAPGATPVQQNPMAKTAWTLVTGTTNCYSGTAPGVNSIPVGPSVYRATVKALRGTAESAWSVVSNRFGRASNAPVPPGSTVIR